MKIRSQDAVQYLSYGEAFAEYSNGNGKVFIRNQFHAKPVWVGTYEDMGRARGVLYEMDLAYQAGQKVFYMPIK